MYNVFTMVVPVETKRVNFRLPEELIQKADTLAHIQHKTRTDIIIEALQRYLQEVEDTKEFKQTVVELYLDDDISFDVLSNIIGKRDADAVRTSKQILEKGDKLAKDLASLGSPTQK